MNTNSAALAQSPRGAVPPNTERPLFSGYGTNGRGFFVGSPSRLSRRGGQQEG